MTEEKKIRKFKHVTEEIANGDEMHTKTTDVVVSQAEIETLKAQLEESQAKVAEYQDGLQRERADFSNYKKRVDQERSQMYQNAVGDIIKQYLPILDDLERALKNRPDNQPWSDGIELIYRKLQDILEAEGIKRIDAENAMFDPIFHEAINQEPSDDHESGKIIAIVQQGYLLGERVIRPALVRVAK